MELASKIILLSILTTGCVQPVTERKVTCDNGFETPWSVNAYVADGTSVKWYDVWDEMAYYKIPGGVTCNKEHRTVTK